MIRIHPDHFDEILREARPWPKRSALRILAIGIAALGYAAVILYTIYLLETS